MRYNLRKYVKYEKNCMSFNKKKLNSSYFSSQFKQLILINKYKFIPYLQ